MKHADNRPIFGAAHARPVWHTIAFALVPLVVLFLAGELLVWTLAPDVRGTTFFRTNTHGLDAYEEDRLLFWKMRDQTDANVAAAKDDAGSRMLVTVGGSIAQGTSPGHFTARLAEQYADATVHNLALAGYTTHQSRVLIDKIAPPARPRVVLVCNGFNDAAAWWKLTDRAIAGANAHWSREMLARLNRSRLFAWVRHRTLQVEDRSSRGFMPGDRVRVPIDHYRENLTAIAERAASAGGRTILVTQAMPSRRNAEMVRPYFEAMAELAASRTDTFFCDVRPRFAIERERLGVRFMEDDEVETVPGAAFTNALFIDGDCHVTDLGYALMAEQIAAIIDEQRLLVGP